MQNSKNGLLPFRHGVPLSDDQRPKTQEEENMMRQVPYASAVGSLMYAMFCTRPDICYSVGMVSRYDIKSRTKTLVSCKAYSQVSSENERLYACLLV